MASRPRMRSRALVEHSPISAAIRSPRRKRSKDRATRVSSCGSGATQNANVERQVAWTIACRQSGRRRARTRDDSKIGSTSAGNDGSSSRALHASPVTGGQGAVRSKQRVYPYEFDAFDPERTLRLHARKSSRFQNRDSRHGRTPGRRVFAAARPRDLPSRTPHEARVACAARGACRRIRKIRAPQAHE